MKKYKPSFMGKVMPVNDPSKLTGFMNDQYESFSKVYDTCKDSSEEISDLKIVDNGDNDKNSLSVKISAPKDTLNEISEKASKDEDTVMQDDVITAKVKS